MFVLSYPDGIKERKNYGTYTFKLILVANPCYARKFRRGRGMCSFASASATQFVIPGVSVF